MHSFAGNALSYCSRVVTEVFFSALTNRAEIMSFIWREATRLLRVRAAAASYANIHHVAIPYNSISIAISL